MDRSSTLVSQNVELQTIGVLVATSPVTRLLRQVEFKQ
jgi:hypothetical protein